jgi:hypothetical protein
MPGKPLIHSGPIIGTEVYGTRVAGIPPGLVAEMYWNFHWAGVILGMILVGIFLRWIYWRCWSLNFATSVIAPLYTFSLIEIGYAVLSHSLGYGVFMKMIDFVMAFVVVLFCTTLVSHQEQSARSF